MRRQRQAQATRVFLVLAVVVASLWAGGLVAAAATGPAGQLAADRSLPGVEPAALPPALRPPVDSSGQNGRLVPVLLGVLVTALGFAHRRSARRPRSGLARARSLVLRTHLEPRAPPFLQPA